MFSGLHLIKKLLFKPISCFGARFKESIICPIVLTCDKDFSLLLCMWYVLFIFSMQLFFCFLEIADMHGDPESHLMSEQHVHTCEGEITRYFSLMSSWVPQWKLPLQGERRCLQDIAICSCTLFCSSDSDSRETCERKNKRGSSANPCCKTLSLGFALWQSDGRMWISISSLHLPTVSMLQRTLCHRHIQVT